MHASGFGKALLSHYPPERIDQMLKKHTLEQFTKKTIVEKDMLLKELDKIRTQGFSFDDEEKALGMRCIAAPIMNFFGEAVAGISVSGPTHRMTIDKIEPISMAVRQAAETLSVNLGSRPGSTNKNL